MNDKLNTIRKTGDLLVDGFHYLALFGIGATIVWSAVYDYLQMMKSGHATLEDILLLFIYLELGAMVGTYFKTHRLPVQFLIYIAITALSRHLVIDVQKVSNDFHLYLLLGITVSIAILSGAVLLLSYTGRHYGCPEDESVTIQQQERGSEHESRD
ncbi:phosphate-starvation-inducible PsiE family protein [Methylomarinum sp. Ch1-1]|uniref:Protein PsiE n=1 Tax=Methylomarinum roseum TaxID=3067653 RepID=A0AAU7NVE0_9GAMM|nr:phosphate-starvation-inducible PsiE family protein [Methylomarinum sp. Ch1-1]MDP4523053.1 phosphate-starvation-inducible PsiE family protein [Methylomarinum sp. Ch1-1]